MERKMRRPRQQLQPEACAEVMRRATSGVLAVVDTDGEPYAVPLSFAYEEGAIYFHSARSGHKLDALTANPRVSFCVIDSDDVVAEEYTTYFRSVIAFGTAHVVDDDNEKLHALNLLADKYAPDETLRREREITGGINRLVVVRMDIERMTGKEAIELVRARSKAGVSDGLQRGL